MKLNWKHWLYTLAKTVIGGVAASASAWLGTLIGNQVDNAIPVLQFNQLWSVLLSSTLLNLFFFLQRAPLPEDESKSDAKPIVPIIILFFMLSLLAGCVTAKQVAKPDGTLTTEYAPDPQAQAIGGALTGTGAAVPPPYGWVLTAAGLLIGGLSQTVANYKNKRLANANADKAQQMEDIATTIIQGVEAAGTAAEVVKKAIAARSETDGNQYAVDALVQKELS